MTEDKKRYVVTGHMAVFDTMTDGGRMRVTYYRGAQVPGDVTPQAIAHNLDVNLIAEVPGNEPAGVDTAGAVVVGDQRPGGGQPGEEFRAANAAQSKTADEQKAAADKATADAEVDKKRADAKAKLPDGGAAPDGRAGQPVWVEYLVAGGSRYEDVKDASKEDLQALAKQRS